MQNEELLFDSLPTPNTEERGMESIYQKEATAKIGEQKRPKSSYDYQAPVQASSVPHSKRYRSYHEGVNMEDMYGRGQSNAEQLKNGFVKFLATTATTFTEGTVGLLNGIGQVAIDRKFSSLFDNEFNRSLDAFNERLEDKYANYYTDSERDAKWYSTKTWMTGNFWGDTILKNAGFSAGAFLSGGVWTKGLTTVVRGLVGSSIRGGSGKLAKIALELEKTALSGAQTTSLNKMGSSLKQIANQHNQIVTSVNIGKTISQGFLASISEAGIEGRHAQKTFEEKLKYNYWEKNGINAKGKDLEDIMEASDKMGQATMVSNVGLLAVTNYFQLGAIKGAVFKSARNSVKGAKRGLGKLNIVDDAGKVVNRGGTRVLRKGEKYVTSTGTTAMGNQLDRVWLGRQLNRMSPYSRILISPREGFEEFSQEVIPNFFENYFENGLEGKETPFYSQLKTSMSEVLNSKDGQLAIMSGLLTGGLMENVASPLMGGRFMNSVKTQRERIRATNTFVQDLNNSTLGHYMKEMDSATLRSQRILKQMEEDLENKDQLNYEDNADNLMLEYITPRVQYGRVDLIIDDMNEQIRLAQDVQGFLDMQEAELIPEGITQREFIEQMTKVKVMAKSMETIFESLNSRYQDVTDDSGNKLYSDSHIMKMAFMSAKIDNLGNMIPSRFDTLNKNGIGVLGVLSNVANGQGSRNATVNTMNNKNRPDAPQIKC